MQVSHNLTIYSRYTLSDLGTKILTRVFKSISQVFKVLEVLIFRGTRLYILGAKVF